jgi:hypothetical protein
MSQSPSLIDSIRLVEINSSGLVLCLNRAPGESIACSAPGVGGRQDESDARLGLLFNLDVHGMQPRAAGPPRASMAKEEDGPVFAHVPRSARGYRRGTCSGAVCDDQREPRQIKHGRLPSTAQAGIETHPVYRKNNQPPAARGAKIIYGRVFATAKRPAALTLWDGSVGI